MKRFISMIGIVIILVCSIPETQSLGIGVQAEAYMPDKEEQSQGEIIQTEDFMVFSEEVSRLSINEPDVLPKEIPELDQYFTKRLIVKARDKSVSFQGYPASKIIKGPDDVSVLQFSSITEAKATSEQLSKDPKVEYVEPDILFGIEMDETNEFSNSVEAVKNEQEEMGIKSTFKSWGVKKIEADKFAKSLSKKKLSSIVAVVDSGVSSHKFLSGRITKNGYDFIDRDKDPSDKNGHGTHIAGTIVDCTPGLNVKIMPVRVMNKNGVGNSITVVNGIKYAADNGAKVINLSLGGVHTKSTDNAIEYAIKKGVIVVAAAGNEYEDVSYSCPAHNPKCITVAALDSKERRAYFSNYGKAIDVAAPGVDILSSIPGGKYEKASGTSMAAPHISAVAAMIKMRYPSKSPAEVEKTIKKISKDVGSTGWDRYFGYGIPKLTKLINAKTIKLNENLIFIAKKSKLKLTATVSPGGYVTWTSSDNKIASVNEDGIVTGNKIGKAVITATTVNGLKASCNVNVLSDKMPLIQPTGITLEQSKLTIDASEVITLAARIKPSNTTFKEVTWTSSDKNVAEVSEYGVVTAYHSGSAVITATTANGFTASCKVTVLGDGVIPTKVTLNQKKLKVMLGETIPLWASVTPENATDKRLNWSTDNDNLKIDENGKITAVKAGVTIIRVTASNSLFDECEITVIDPAFIVKPKEVILSQGRIEVEAGATAQLFATVKPDNVTDPTVVYTSNNSLIADVTPQGMIIGKMKGNANITVRASNGIKEVCYVTVVNPVIVPNGIILDKNELTLEEGKTYKFVATITPSNVTDKTITWTSSNSKVAYINYSGGITAYTEGTAVITAKTSNGFTAYCTVTVKKAPILPYIVNVYTPKRQIEVDEKVTLTTSIYPNNVDDKTLTWSSSDKSIAQVDEKGVVTGMKAGNVTITAQASNGTKGVITITINDYTKLITSIDFEQVKVQMTVGENKVLTLLATPKSVALRNINWSSVDSSVAMVDSGGKVTAMKEGSTSIIAKLSNGLSAECKITVKAISIPVSEISLSQQQLHIETGKSATLAVNFSPSNATQKEVSWSSSTPEIAGVSNSGVVTGYKTGTATITAKSSNGLTASCTVTVTAAEVIPISIVLDVTELNMQIGETKTLIATVTPQNVDGSTVSWTSSDQKVVGVNSKGEVTCYGAGTAVITAATANGVSAVCTVTVKSTIVLPDGISLDNQTVQIQIGGTSKLTAILTPSNVTEVTLMWTSSNPEIATVDTEGNIMALAEGGAVITVRTANNYETSCTVNVVTPSNDIPIISEMFSLKTFKIYESFMLFATSYK